MGLGRSGGPEDPDMVPIIVHGRLIPQPGDGSCLFHSLGYFLGESHQALRNTVAAFIESNPDEKVVGTELRRWIEWDSKLNPRAYATRLRSQGSWGGALEMATLAHLKGMLVYVYERNGAGSFKRIAAFGEEDERATGGQTCAHVLYGGRVHYDALQIGQAQRL